MKPRWRKAVINDDISEQKNARFLFARVFIGIAKDAIAKILPGIVGITFSLYKDQEGGADFRLRPSGFLDKRPLDPNWPVNLPDFWNHGSMAKRKTQKQSAKATLAEVIKEMAKKRVAMSARGGSWRWLSWRWSSEFSSIGLIVLLIYKSTLTMHRDDQLFLDDASSHMHEEQTELLALPSRFACFSIGSGVFLLVLVAMSLNQKLTAVQ
jgi:hypothetical protein